MAAVFHSNAQVGQNATEHLCCSRVRTHQQRCERHTCSMVSSWVNTDKLLLSLSPTVGQSYFRHLELSRGNPICWDYRRRFNQACGGRIDFALPKKGLALCFLALAIG